MINDIYTSSERRPTGALQIAANARAFEKEMALRMAEAQAEQNDRNTQMHSRRGLLETLLTSLRIF